MNSPAKLTLALIISNEFCERFCYYGFRTLLFLYLRSRFLYSDNKSTQIVHLFNFGCYIFTFIGGLLSDALIGRYKTILYLSVIYLIGTILTTVSTVYYSIYLLLCGLFCISLGTGGIKPCVSTFGGDQFPKTADKTLLTKFFSFFYFAINAGSLLSMLCMPVLASLSCFNTNNCYLLAFGLPTLLLAISLRLFVYGSDLYVKKEPDSDYMFKYFRWLLSLVYKPKNRSRKDAGINLEGFMVQPTNINVGKDLWFNQTAREFGIDFAKDMRRALRIFKIFLLVPFFWMLYDQQTTTWVNQATEMQTQITIKNRTFHILPAQMQALNGLLILVLIPIFSHMIYPIIKKTGYNFHSLRKMTFGIFFASLSFFIAAYIENLLHKNIHIMWQLPQYIMITIGEVLLSVTGIEFAYIQAPKTLKGIVLSAWLVTVAIGNLYVIIFTSLDIFRWLKIENAVTYNYVMYGFIGLIATYYFYRNSVSYTQKSKKQDI